jgi:tetratricopeptide (TPR) repeat protein
VAGTLPAGRPDVGRPGGPASRPGISTLPAAGVGAGLGAIAGSQRPGLGERPAQLPGLGRTDRWQQIRENRPEWVADRRQDLQGRLDHRNDAVRDWQGSRQDFLTDRREDWQNWLDDRYPWHDGWHHGYWHGPWQGYWEHMWAEHPVWATFGVTSWTLNALSYSFGVAGYSNPYYDYPTSGEAVYDYSQPIVAYSEPAPAQTAESSPPGVSPTALDLLDQARSAFYQGDYSKALGLSDQALKAMPNDAVIHEFRALCLFALGYARPAAAALHAVLAVGPGWDWTTLSSLYPDTETYTKQLRQLEQFVRSQPDQADAQFVLAYHYMTLGHTDSAARCLKSVLRLVPGDTVAQQLYDMLSYKPSESGPPKPATETPQTGPKLKAADLAGTWKARGPGDSNFELTLTGAGEFTWKYARGKKRQTVRGAFAVDADTLAMEPESGGVLVAQLTPQGKDALAFTVVGSKSSDSTLTFRRD